MRDEVARDLRQSAHDFLTRVGPLLMEHCPAFRRGRLCLVEGQQHNPIAFDLDVLAGIDAYLCREGMLQGIALRLQWGRAYQTFTIRAARPTGVRTEYQKRLEATQRREEGFLYPSWTIQAYLTQPGGEVLSVAVARTVELYQYVETMEKQSPGLPQQQARSGREAFLCVRWEQYRRSGNYLFTFLAGASPHALIDSS